MQSKTRYISVQIGIGGWQPTTASEVDHLGYGDCKGLTNYMKALLASQDIESYYTIVDAGRNGRDLDEDFIALQGNHVFLTIPFEDERVFLECTSQDLPFNYLGIHTDNRKVLMVTPEGGVMVKTPEYSEKETLESSTASVVLREDLVVAGKVSNRSSGIAYNFRYGIKDFKKDEIDNFYKSEWSHLNDLQLSNIQFKNNKDDIVFEETLDMETSGYLSKAGDRILLNPNLFRRIQNIPSKTEKRTQSVEIRRGYSHIDEINWTIPQDYKMESVFSPIDLVSEFGTYKARAEQQGNTIVYTREFVLRSGSYPKEAFNTYVEFIKEVAKKDRSKIVLTKI